MTVLHECYQSGDDASFSVSDTVWGAMSFTVGVVGANEEHSLTSVKMKFKRTGSPGMVDVEIYEVDGSGHPTGSVLSSGSFDGDAVTTDAAGELVSCTMSSYVLQPSTKYIIVVYMTGGGLLDYLSWFYDNNNGAYTGGDRTKSIDSGSTWDVLINDDCIFEVYGTPPSTAVEESMSFGVKRRILV